MKWVALVLILFIFGCTSAVQDTAETADDGAAVDDSGLEDLETLDEEINEEELGEFDEDLSLLEDL